MSIRAQCHLSGLRLNTKLCKEGEGAALLSIGSVQPRLSSIIEISGISNVLQIHLNFVLCTNVYHHQQKYPMRYFDEAWYEVIVHDMECRFIISDCCIHVKSVCIKMCMSAGVCMSKWEQVPASV